MKFGMSSQSTTWSLLTPYINPGCIYFFILILKFLYNTCNIYLLYSIFPYSYTEMIK